MLDPKTLRPLLIALNSCLGLPRESICRLARRPEVWLDASRSPDTVAAELSLPQTAIERARGRATSADMIALRELEQARGLGAQVLTLADADYPAELRQLELPPPVLYLRGQLPQAPAVAIVGSRSATPAGLEIAELFGRELATRGLTVVSGFARGIDLAAHRGALRAAGGSTVAVLGCGLDIEYPRGRRHIIAEMTKHGALLTEFPFGASPLARNFPIRNRIIAALTLGTLVVQGAPRSGSLITARLALDLGRDVYAVPGPIFDPRSSGPNALIRDGALLAQHPRDIVESLPSHVQASLPTHLGQPSESAPKGPKLDLLRHLEPGELVSADGVALRTGLPLERALGLLVELELDGFVRRYPGSMYCRSP